MLKAATSHALHLLAEAVLGIAGLLALAGCALVWRLGQGPIDITALVQREQHRLPKGTHLTIGRAVLAWEGFHDPDSPLDIRFTDLGIRDAAGVPLAQLPSGRVTLAVAPLWRGHLAPRTVAVRDATVALHRAADGALRLDLGSDTKPGAAPQGPGAAPLLAGLARPGSMPLLAQLQSVRLDRATVTLDDVALGVLWRADAADIVLRRQKDGSVSGDAALDLAVGRAQVRIATRVELSQSGVRLVASQATPVSPADVARAVPALRALAAVDAPITLGLAARFDPDLRLLDATASLQAGAGTVKAGQGEVQLASAAAVLRAGGAGATLSDVRIALRPVAGSRLPGPVLTGSATARRAAGRVTTSFSLAVDRVAFGELGGYWPLGTGGGSRSWVTGNISAGVAQNAHVAGTLNSGADGSDIQVTALSGGVDGRDVTVAWLKPVPPIEHAEAHLTIDGPDALHIDMPRAMQGALKLSDGSIRIAGLQGKDQSGAIAVHIDGELAQVLALLNHPRLQLLSRRPIPLNQPAGQGSAVLNVTLPLDDRITLDQIGIRATARLADVHLGAIAAGRDLDRGQLSLRVDTDELDIGGTGDIGGMPAQLGVMMDFRNGKPSQVLARMTATGHATPAQFATAKVPAGDVVTGGAVGFDVTYEARRDTSGGVDINLDLGAAAVGTPFGWSKEVGPPARASARLLLQQDRLVGIDRISATGPDLSLSSHLETESGRPSRMVLDQVRLGRSNLHGSIFMPGATDPRWRVTLRGAALDLSAYLKARDASTTDTGNDEKRGPPWQADLAFDQVVLARDETLAPATAKVSSDGLHLTRMDVAAGPAGQVRATIKPSATGRALRVDATDAGAVLLAAGVADNIRGGTLKLDASFDDRAPHAPLAGTATLDGFRITDAPAIGRLLKAMTFYGAVDLLRGPGLGFQRAVAPFRWQQRVLTLQNARAFSASLGLTAEGDIDLRRRTANVTGTIVPAYFFNQLLGRIPLLGKIFSPEKGGGVFAARYAVKGSLADPSIGVNPLSALTPGFLRGVFGLF